MAELKILLSAIGADAVDGAFGRASRSVRELDTAVKLASTGFDKVAAIGARLAESWAPLEATTAIAEDFGSSLEKALSPVALANGAFALAGEALGVMLSGMEAVAGAVFDVGSKFDRLQVQMDAVFGSGNAADRALEWAQNFESGVPQDIEEITQRMIALKRQGFDPLEDGGKLMTALGDAAQATGLSFDRLLEPLAKMNVTGMVDFKSLVSLAKEGIPVFEILEEKTGLTAAQIKKMGADALDGRAAMELLTDALGERYAGAMEKATQTAEVGLSKIGDLGEDAAKRIADAGAWEAFSDAVHTARTEIEAVLNTDEFDQFAKDVSNLFSEIAYRVEDLVKDVARAAPIVMGAISGIIGGLDKALSMAGRLASGDYTSFLAGELETQSSMIADFTSDYEKSVGIAQGIRDNAALGEWITEEEVMAGERNLLKKEESIDQHFKKLIAEENKALAEQKKAKDELAKYEEQLASQREKMAKTLFDREIDQQKDLLREELDAEKERMDAVKDAMENRNRMEKLVWDYRQSLADAQFDRENEQEEKMLRRRLEDQDIASDRYQDDLMARTQKYLYGEGGSDDEIRNFLKAAGEENALWSSRGRGLSFVEDTLKRLRRFQEDQDRTRRRSNEDEMDALKDLNEDQKRDREFMKKTEEEQRAQQFKAMVDLATSLKDFKGQIDHKIKILDTTKFVNEFMREVFKESKIRAKIESVVVAGV